MEWGEEGAQQGEEVGHLGAMHVPLLSQSGPNLRRCAREAAATSPPGQDGRLYFAASRTALAPVCRTRFAGATGRLDLRSHAAAASMACES